MRPVLGTDLWGLVHGWFPIEAKLFCHLLPPHPLHHLTPVSNMDVKKPERDEGNKNSSRAQHSV